MTNWGRIFTPQDTEEEFIFLIGKAFLEINKRKTDYFKQWQGTQSRQVKEQETQVTREHIKRCSSFLIIREMKRQKT